MRAKLKLAAVLLACLLSLAALAQAETVQRGSLRLSFDGQLTPHSLPREKQAPVKVSVAAKIASTNAKAPPQLRSISIAINRYGRLQTKGLAVCELEEIQPATTADALAVCRRSLIGEGSFSANVLLKGQAPFPSEGKIFAFNGEIDGRPAILAHVYGTTPAPTSYTLPFLITHPKGTFGTLLKVSLPQGSASSGYITGLSLDLGKSFAYRGHKRSYLSASCPAPKGFPGAVFPFAKASFAFAGGREVSSVLTRSCGVR